MYKPVKWCMCEIHIKREKEDAGKKEYIKCVGHGLGCPCYEERFYERKRELEKNNSAS